MKKWIANKECHKKEVPSIVSVMISTDSQPGFGRSLRGERKELENENESNYIRNTPPKEVPSGFWAPNAEISKPPENLPFAPKKVT